MVINNLKIGSLILVWLMHISAFVGLKLGYSNFFLPLSSITLWYICFLVICFYPLWKDKRNIFFILIASIGFTVEVLGVATGLIFGEYAYGNNLGLKVFDVPIIIGVNWAILSYVSSGIAGYLNKTSNYVKALFASFLMLMLDFFMEFSAPALDYWRFYEDPIPVQNYITWFILAFIFNLIILQIKQFVDKNICVHIYLSQLLFFIFLYVF